VTRTLLPLVMVALTTMVLAACEDEDLNEFGAAGAHETMVEVVVHDGWFVVDGSGGAGEVAQAQIDPHNDVTFHVTNAGVEVHSFALYADAAGQDLLVETGPIPPGESAVATFHFHDVQVAYFRDNNYTGELVGELRVGE
jgi:hypothetical protein